MSSSALLFPCPPSCPVGTGLRTPVLQPGLCSQMLALSGSAARCWHTPRLPSSPRITGNGVSLPTLPQREQPLEQGAPRLGEAVLGRALFG